MKKALALSDSIVKPIENEEVGSKRLSNCSNPYETYGILRFLKCSSECESYGLGPPLISHGEGGSRNLKSTIEGGGKPGQMWDPIVDLGGFVDLA